MPTPTQYLVKGRVIDYKFKLQVTINILRSSFCTKTPPNSLGGRFYKELSFLTKSVIL